MQMIQRVLAGLQYIILEIYLDDVLVYGTSEEDFLANLERTFERMHEYNLTLHPDKCEFGMSAVEYVGHTIDDTGVHFSVEKRETVLNIPRPISQKQMKSFLGLCNYFSTHVHHYDQKARPLHSLVTPYIPTKRLEWTEGTTEAFEELKTAVHGCQKLYFIDPQHGQIHVMTDASDYGIGAYVCQRVQLNDDPKPTEYPIFFISKTLDSVQRRWATVEKECYAIWYTLKKLDYILRDVTFVLHTDHRNLTYLSSNGSPKVIRWKLDIQESSMALTYIKGEHN